MRNRLARTLCMGLLAMVGGCDAPAAEAGSTAEAGATADPPTALQCAPDDGGLTLPSGFCAVVVADGLDAPRHMAVAPNGDLYVALRGGRGVQGGLMALRDTTGDGGADVRVRIDEQGGTGVELWRDWVYFGRDDAIIRYRLGDDGLGVAGGAEVMVSGLRASGGHAAKPVEITPDGTMFVSVGSPSNACQVQDRRAGSPGKDPCDELESNAGIWRFDATAPGQTQADGQRFATGLRNTVALEYNEMEGQLYGAVHGRDQLHQNWGEMYSAREGAELPAEELVRIDEGDDFGWPYCYYDPAQQKKVLAPEYGGDKSTVGRCASKEDPVVAFPAHWAPNGLAFYDGDSFPRSYRGGAFIAFHGSWNRAPFPQQGYKVVFVPRTGGEFRPDWQDFATGFVDGEKSPAAEHRPTGVTVGPDGSLYISDDAGGRIWRVLHRSQGSD